MAKQYFVATGTAAFVNLLERDTWKGQPTNYNVTLTLDPDCIDELKNNGVKLKEYEDTLQRKFQSNFEVQVLDTEGDNYTGQVPRGSRLKVLYSLGKPSPMHGVTAYLEKVKVIELADPTGSVEDF